MAIVTADACSNTRVSTPQGDVIGRTMELGGYKGLASTLVSATGLKQNIYALLRGRKKDHSLDEMLPWEVVVHPKGEYLGGNAGSNFMCRENSVKWANQYAHVSIDALGTSTEGMNDAGLTVSVQTFLEAKYQQPPTESSNQSTHSPVSVCVQNSASWMLGNFGNVSALQQALQDADAMRMVGLKSGLVEKAVDGLSLIHWSVDDALGGHIVVEYIDGKLHVHNNTVGTVTNDPPFDWHLRNLNNYVNLSPSWPDRNNDIRVPSEVGLLPTPVGHGSGLLGLPGDYTAAGRFVKLFYLKQYAQLNQPPRDLGEGVTLTTRLLDTVMIPRGSLAAEANEPLGYEFTQWSVLKIPEKRQFFVKDYKNSQWRKLDLTQMNMAVAASMPVADGSRGIKDESARFD